MTQEPFTGMILMNSERAEEELRVMEKWLFPNMYPKQCITFEGAYLDWLKKPGNEGKGIEDFKNAFSNKEKKNMDQAQKTPGTVTTLLDELSDNVHITRRRFEVSETRTLLSVEAATELLVEAGMSLAENEAVVQYGDQPWIVSIKGNMETRIRPIGVKREIAGIDPVAVGKNIVAQISGAPMASVGALIAVSEEGQPVDAAQIRGNTRETDLQAKIAEVFQSFHSEPMGEVSLFWTPYSSRNIFTDGIKEVTLINESLRTVNPYSRDPSREDLDQIIVEAAQNPAYNDLLQASGDVHKSIDDVINKIRVKIKDSVKKVNNSSFSGAFVERNTPLTHHALTDQTRAERIQGITMQDNNTKPTQEEGVPAVTEHPVQDVVELDPLPGDQCEGEESLDTISDEDEVGAADPAMADGLDSIPTETTAEEVAAIGVKIEETLAFKMAQELGIEMKDMLIRDPNAEVDRSTLRFEDHPLVGGVTRLFQFLNHPRPEEWLIDLDEEYLSDPRQVQALLTHHLHRHLSRLEIHESKASIQIRQILNPDDKLSNWMVMLELIVIPFMIDNDLPMGMTGRDPLAPVSPAAQIHNFAEKQEVAKTGEAPVTGELDHAIPIDVEPAETNLAYDNARLDPEHAVIDSSILTKETPTIVAYFGGYPLVNEELRYLDLDNLSPEIIDAMVAESLVTPKYFAALWTASFNQNPRKVVVDIVARATEAGAKLPVFDWGALDVDDANFKIGDFELDNEALRNVNPYSKDLSHELKLAVAKEAGDNPLYFAAIVTGECKFNQRATDLVLYGTKGNEQQ